MEGIGGDFGGGGRNGKPKVRLGRVRKCKEEEKEGKEIHTQGEGRVLKRGVQHLRVYGQMEGEKKQKTKCVIGGAEEGRKEVGRGGEEDKNQSRGQ